MEKLLALLKDGHARTIEQMAAELTTTVEDIKRQLEYLQHIGVIRKVSFQTGGCAGCAGCMASAHSGASVSCKDCMPKGGVQYTGNDQMQSRWGEMWEVISVSNEMR